jgi:hypothetical protein
MMDPGKILTVRDWNLIVASAVSEEKEAGRAGHIPLGSIHFLRISPVWLQPASSLCDIASYTRTSSFTGT